MAQRRALIVDDSKTAQIRLRKMLEKFDLEVDTVLSAEEALGYLSYRQPAVVFMDHHMEGMDGLEALKIIKSNPTTALLPVIMYTSEKGDVYVGQARALGALDIIGKEVIKQSSLEKVLGSLGIRSAGEKSTKDAEPVLNEPLHEREGYTADQPNYTADQPSYAPASANDESLTHVQRQISRLFEIHITKVRQEIEDNTKFLFRRISKEIQDKHRQQMARVEELDSQQGTRQAQVAPPPPPSKISRWWPVAAAAGLLALGFIGLQLMSANTQLRAQQGRLTQLLDQNAVQRQTLTAIADDVAPPGAEAQASAYADRQILLDALSWAVNVNTQVSFGELALSDQRIYMLGELLALLKAANFDGSVFLDVHLGNFCIVEDPSGRAILPDPESNVEDCVLMASRNPDVTVDGQVSVGFQNYLESAPILAEGNIDVELASQGFDVPRFTYPPMTSGVSAGEWNSVAAKNNRISVSFSTN